METEQFLQQTKKLGIDFYTGVPDSQLAPLCDALYRKYGAAHKHHVVAANEGGAVGLAAGHYIAAGRPALVYMQNSGLGNAVNPIASLLHEQVYGIPCLFVVGWGVSHIRVSSRLSCWSFWESGALSWGRTRKFSPAAARCWRRGNARPLW